MNQEKARLKARSTAAAAASGAEQAAVDASITSKQMVINQLQEKVESMQAEVTHHHELLLMILAIQGTDTKLHLS